MDTNQDLQKFVGLINQNLSENFPELKDEMRIDVMICEGEGQGRDVQNSVDCDKRQILTTCIYCCEDNNKKDSRISGNNSWKRKNLIWKAFAKTESITLRALAKIIIGELKSRMEDLIFLVNLEDNTKLKEYLLEYVMDRELVMKRYTKEILNHHNLPSGTFLTLLSSQYYERQELFATIIFDNNEKDLIVKFKTEKTKKMCLKESNLRLIRKLLEIAKNDEALVVNDSLHILGTKHDDGKGIRIVFKGRLKWEVYLDDNLLLLYDEGMYRINKRENDENRYKEKIQSFPGVQYIDEDRIDKLIEVLKKQCHGTAIVFLKNQVVDNVIADLRKCNRLYDIEVNGDTEDTLINISSIDGAVIANFSGEIKAIGAILDGVSIVEANPARGARYNSLKNYVNWLVKNKKCNQKECFAVIMSEDKSVDVEYADETQWIEHDSGYEE